MEDAGTRDYLYWISSLVEDQISGVLATGGEGGGPIVTTAVEAIHFARGMHVWQIRASWTKDFFPIKKI